MNPPIHLLDKIFNEIYIVYTKLLGRYFRETKRGADEIDLHSEGCGQDPGEIDTGPGR